MFNLNKYFYYDSKEIYGHLKIEKNTLRLSQKLSGQYLKEILKTSLEDKWGLVCSGNFMLSLVDETEGCKLLTLESSNNIISFDKKILEEIIKTKSEYIFEIFSNSKDIAILVEDEINRNINNTTVECIQNFAFPTAHFTRESNDLFYKGTLNYFPLEGKSVKWFIGGKKQPIADFNTYFNSFNYEKWKENTDIKKVFVSFELKGEVILRLKEICDLVIIDGTPCELVTDSIILSRIVDSTVIVTAHKQTKKDDLQKIVTNIQNVGGKIAGIVLNKIPVSAKKYEQSYYYGSTSMTAPRPRNTRPSSNRPATRPMSVQNKREDMKRRVRPENPQLNRVQQERRQKTNDNEQPKALQNKINIQNTGEASIEKTTDILNQINAYLDEEKKNLSNKS